MHLSNVHFVLNMTSLHCLTLLGARDCPNFTSLSKEAIERSGGGKEGMGGRREVVKAKNLAENKVHV